MYTYTCTYMYTKHFQVKEMIAGITCIYLSLDNGSEESSHLEQVKVSEAGGNTTVQQHQPWMVALLHQDIARVEVSVHKVMDEELHMDGG